MEQTQFTSKNIKFQGEYAIDKSSIESFIEEQKNKEEWKINTYKKSSTTLQPPAVLITSTLQQKASTNLRFSPKMTMSYEQELYENGLFYW